VQRPNIPRKSIGPSPQSSTGTSSSAQQNIQRAPNPSKRVSARKRRVNKPDPSQKSTLPQNRDPALDGRALRQSIEHQLSSASTECGEKRKSASRGNDSMAQRDNLLQTKWILVVNTTSPTRQQHSPRAAVRQVRSHIPRGSPKSLLHQPRSNDANVQQHGLEKERATPTARPHRSPMNCIEHALR